ncbi:MAG: hybrid sensor histidine kinase/response regulator, partial [Pedobacter sp.]
MILLVDDLAENRISLQRTLQKNGFEVETANNGEQALKMALKKNYVLIILDVQMPGMDGFEVAEHLSGYSGAKDTAIIFLSAAVQDEQFIIKGLKNGAVDYITKPVKPEILLQKIDIFYRIYHQNRNLIAAKHDLQDEIETRKKAEALKDEFVGIASHELKTPLTSAKAYLQLLTRNLKTGQINKSLEYLSKAELQLDRIESLISDLLDISKIESGKMTLNMARFDFSAMLQGILDMFAASHDQHKFLWLLKIAVSVTGDQARIEQVIINLLSNAVKYAPDSFNIEIRTKLVNGMVMVCIKDFGIGIPEKKQELIFEKFYRTHNAQKHFSGFGMGLYI